MSNATPAAASSATTTPGWEEDIRGIFAPFTAQMMWRFNLGSYDDVKANAAVIEGRLRTFADMPPPPFPPLSETQLETFYAWVAAGCPETRPAG